VGVTFGPGRPEDLGRALSELGRDQLEAMQKRARRLALERFNSETQAETLARIWAG